MRMYIIVNTTCAGTHFWSECNIEEVGYLAQKHRHNFHITCKKEVMSTNREIEIISLKAMIDKHLANFNGSFGWRSCEAIACDLISTFDLSYCAVLEDGENGAEVWAS